MLGALVDERGDIGVFAPVRRPRLVERLTASAAFPVSLLIAPAGYGKSVILRQYLATLTEPYLRFTVRPEHSSLLGFLRGFAEATRDLIPHAITTLPGAYERAMSSRNGTADLANWMHAHLEAFAGTLAIDDMHLVDADAAVMQFLTALIERTKLRVRWIIASRSAAGLPLGTWQAYRDADVPISEIDLRFTPAEVEDAVRRVGSALGRDELADLLKLTEGWPAAIGFALRTSTRSSELRNVSALTREMIYRLLAEQVYSRLTTEERELLEVATALPVIDVAVLENAGFDRALTIVERLREQTAFIYEEAPGIYQCHDLFRDFLRRQSALGGKHRQQTVNRRAACALEGSGDVEHAILAYLSGGSPPDAVRLLEQHGFDLLERARGDVVGRAIEALDEPTRRNNARILALCGALQATAGKLSRAESLFRRALAGAGCDNDLVAIASLRLGSLLANQGESVVELLEPLGSDVRQSPWQRAEALSLIAAQQAVTGNLTAARSALGQLDPLLSQVDSEAVQSKVLHRMGIAFHNLGVPDRAFEVLRQSSDLATQLHLYSIISRVNAVLSNLVLHEEDDVAQQLRYAEFAAVAATKAGDAFALQTALLQTLSARMRLGDVEASIAIEQRLAAVRTGEIASRYVAIFRSERLAWEGRFGEAHRLLSSCWARMSFDFDRIIYGSEYALFLALDDDAARSSRVIKELHGLIEGSEVRGAFRIRATTIAKVLAALTEAINGRGTIADRLLRSVAKSGDAVISATMDVADGMIHQLRYRSDIGSDRIRANIEDLRKLAYADLGRLLEAVRLSIAQRLAERTNAGSLTPTEHDVLRLLASGLSPKEIAERMGRSVHTVRVHVANLNLKLGCHGRVQIVRVAQQLGLV